MNVLTGDGRPINGNDAFHDENALCAFFEPSSFSRSGRYRFALGLERNGLLHLISVFCANVIGPWAFGLIAHIAAVSFGLVVHRSAAHIQLDLKECAG